MQRDSAVLRIFLRVIAQMLQANSPGAAHTNKAALHIGAVAFIHRFGPSPNEHVHFHVCAVDGVLEAVVGEASEQGTRTTATRVMFHPATGIASKAVAQAQASLRRRILRAFVGRACSKALRPRRCWATNTAGFRRPPACASPHKTEQAWSACCAAVRGAGAATACAPKLLLRRAGAPFTAQGCGGGAGRRPNRRHGHGKARARRCAPSGGCNGGCHGCGLGRRTQPARACPAGAALSLSAHSVGGAEQALWQAQPGVL